MRVGEGGVAAEGAVPAAPAECTTVLDRSTASDRVVARSVGPWLWLYVYSKEEGSDRARM